ncbi:hypothetical protein M0804_010028 [Polistes exclamans]|nr:hypothetical protein M0804_010028 [Polistes exclamans]
MVDVVVVVRLNEDDQKQTLYVEMKDDFINEKAKKTKKNELKRRKTGGWVGGWLVRKRKVKKPCGFSSKSLILTEDIAI